MTIKTSGSLSLYEINTEFGRGYNLNAYRGTGYWNSNATTGTFSSGAITINDFFGKALNRPAFTAQVLVVGGGGGGGVGTQDFHGGGGGGGGGGQYYAFDVVLQPGASASVTIGGGGAGGYITYLYDSYGNVVGATYWRGTNGGSTTAVFNGSSYTAVGGNIGYGRWYNGGANGESTPYVGGAGGAGNAGGGYNSVGGSDGVRAAGGGGGVDDAWCSGAGGAGPMWYNGSRYSGGGGGGGEQGQVAGGAGGGGAGGGGSIRGANGMANTGGGGGAGGSYSYESLYAGRGGSGIVIIRYVSSFAFFSGGSAYASGGYIYHVFTGNASFTT